jgi:hypothetical protein
MEAEMKSQKDNENEGHAQEILDNTFGKVDFSALAKQQKHLPLHQQDMLHELWNDYQDLFQGNVGEWPDEGVDIELLPNSSPYHQGTRQRFLCPTTAGTRSVRRLDQIQL